MEIQIKRAELKDLDLIVKWRMETLEDVFADQKDSFPEDLEEKNRAYYEQALPAGRHIACFALADGRIVGCGGICLYQELPSPDNPGGLCAYLMNIYCRPAYRRQGVGTAIVRWLVSRAGERGITKIFLEASDAGRALYREIGFSDMPDMMEYLTKETGEGTV